MSDIEDNSPSKTGALPNIEIQPIARRNHLVFILFGIISLVASFVFQEFGIKLVGVALLLFGISIFMLGIFKAREPEVSMELTPDAFIWHLRHGSINIPWSNIVDLRPLKIRHAKGESELHYLGLKLWDLRSLVDSISPRNAKNLYHEYRSLVHVSLVEARFRGEAAESIQEHSENWIDNKGDVITDLKGVFAARLAQLKTHLGCDLYLPLTSLDRSQEDFIEMFRQYHQEYQMVHAND